MNFNKIKTYAKINLALNIISKSKDLHKIESLVAFIDLYDLIKIKKIKSKNHKIKFYGKFSKNINSNNTVSKLLRILDEKNMIKINTKQIYKIAKMVGSDVILGLNIKNSILTSNNKIKRFSNCKKLYSLIIKPNFGCSTKYIYSNVRKFDKSQFNNPSKKMFNLDFLKNMNNSLEKIVLDKYLTLKKIKSYLNNLKDPIFVRMTGSGSAFVSYYYSKKQCERAKKQFNKDYNKFWCISSKTI